MLDKYGIDDSKIYKIAVIATMSSGKSTFINALIGCDILPSQNQACTAKIIPILDNDNAKVFKAYIEYKKGNKEIIDIDKDNMVGNFNLSDDIKDILIEGNIEGIRNTEKVALLIDTPGTNFSGDNTHQKHTYDLIDNFNEGMFLYIINATQIGIEDDLELLTYVNNKIKVSNGKIKLLFVVNKIDEFDLEKEDVEYTINEIEEYLKINKVENPQIVPVSALAAKLFKLGMNNKELTRKEQRDFRDYYDMFKFTGYSLNKYAHIEKNIDINESINIGSENFKKVDILKAIDNTGITYVERLIEDEMISKNKVFTPQIKFNLNRIKNSELIKDNLKGIKKSNVYIEYNPYTVETKIEIDGQPISNESSLKKCNYKRLQYWLDKNGNWQGIIEELRRYVNNVEDINITFKGRKIDFDDLKLTVDKYNANNNIILDFIQGKDDNDVLKNIDKLFKEIQNGPIEELKTENLKRAYEEVKYSKFKISVIATMSSGKSTLINSLIGYELLPSKNMACTATVVRITDNNEAKEFKAVCRDSNGKIIYKKDKISLKDIEEYNADEKVIYIDLEGKIPGISSDKLNLLLYDTPGPNNSKNEVYGELIRRLIEDEKKGVVLYILNETQFGINDDADLLKDISFQMKRGGKQSKDRFIFVINKCDELDTEKGESVDSLLECVKEYLKEYDIEDPILFPVTAQGAKLIRMFKNNADFTRKEKKELDGIVEDFNDLDGYHFEKKCTLSEACRENIDRKLKYAIENNDKYEEALIHTGIPCIEETINEYLEKYAYPIKINDSINEIKGIIDEKTIKLSLADKISKYSNEYTILKNKIMQLKQIRIDISESRLVTNNKLLEIITNNFKNNEKHLSIIDVQEKINQIKKILLLLNEDLYKTKLLVKEVKDLYIDLDEVFKKIEEENTVKSYYTFKENIYIPMNINEEGEFPLKKFFRKNQVNYINQGTRINSQADWLVMENKYVDYNNVINLLLDEVEVKIESYYEKIEKIVDFQIEKQNKNIEVIYQNINTQLNYMKIINCYLYKIKCIGEI